jgi:hypothetical protein
MDSLGKERRTMIPTLRGRIQTRLFAVLVIGGIWTALVTPALPGMPADLTGGDRYEMTFSILIAVAVLGVAWELLYHYGQQWRWEKDWPTQFGLLTGINEAILIGILLRVGWIPGVADPGPPAATWITHFVTTWLVIFLFLNGPMKVVFLRWRFRGGRLVGP